MSEPDIQDILQKGQELEQRNKELDQANKQLGQENKDLKTEIAMLRQQNQAMKKVIFGPKSEKQKAHRDDEDTAMLNLFNEAEAEARPNQPEAGEETTVQAHKRKKRQPLLRKELVEALPHEEELIPVAKQDRVCPTCGTTMSYLGKEKVRTEIRIIPAQIKVVDIYREAYECRSCRKQGQSTIRKADVPNPVLPHSYASPGSVVHTMLQKYQYAMPLYRQEEQWKTLGLPVPRSVLANWVIIPAQEWLFPLIRRMHTLLLEEPCIHADETPVQVHREKGRKNTTKSYMWAYASSPFEAKRQIRLFEYQPTRNGDHAKDFLKGYAGYLVTDDFSGYTKVEGITRCLCWAHARRLFVNAIPANMPKEQLTGTVVQTALDKLGELFQIEQTLKDLPSKVRQKERQKQEKPLLEAYFAWAETVVDTTGNGAVRKALHYSLSNKPYLENYLLDGHVAMTNNTAENSIRPFVIGRKNWLFSDSPKGAAASAAVYSIIETCKANAIDPGAYLLHVFTKMPSEPQLDDETLDKYLPWNINLERK